MYSAAFIFKPGTYDDEFHRLNDLIPNTRHTSKRKNSTAAGMTAITL